MKMQFNFMKLIIISIMSAGLFSSTTLAANEIPKTIEYNDTELILNGHGTRVVFFMKVYDGSLYLAKKSTDAKEIVNNNAPMAIRIDVISEMVTAEAMKKALKSGNFLSMPSKIDALKYAEGGYKKGTELEKFRPSLANEAGYE